MNRIWIIIWIVQSHKFRIFCKTFSNLTVFFRNWANLPFGGYYIFLKFRENSPRFRRRMMLSTKMLQNFEWRSIHYYSESLKLWRVFAEILMSEQCKGYNPKWKKAWKNHPDTDSNENCENYEKSQDLQTIREKRKAKA